MKPKANDKKVSPSLSNLTQIIRNSLLLSVLSAVIVSAICLIFGWRSLENIGTGFIYGSLVLALFGILTFAGNTLPAQLFKLSLPKYNSPFVERRQNIQSDEPIASQQVIRYFSITIICAVVLFITGVILKIA